jgi:hypothetical protein
VDATPQAKPSTDVQIAPSASLSEHQHTTSSASCQRTQSSTNDSLPPRTNQQRRTQSSSDIDNYDVLPVLPIFVAPSVIENLRAAIMPPNHPPRIPPPPWVIDLKNLPGNKPRPVSSTVADPPGFTNTSGSKVRAVATLSSDPAKLINLRKQPSKAPPPRTPAKPMTSSSRRRGRLPWLPRRLFP